VNGYGFSIEGDGEKRESFGFGAVFACVVLGLGYNVAIGR